MASEKWSNPTVCLVPMSWPTEYARHLDVRTTSIYPLPKMSPDRALGDRIRRFRSVLDLFSRSLGEPTGPTTTFSTRWGVLRRSYAKPGHNAVQVQALVRAGL